MGAIDDLQGGELRDILRRLRALETATPLNHASIGAGGVRVHSGGVITIQNGGLSVTGTAEIIGRLLASGIIDLTGDVTVSGPFVVAAGGKITAGSIELNPDGSATFGTMTIGPDGKITTGTAEINPDGSAKFGDMTISAAGVITLNNDLNVTGGGKIKAGVSQINPDGTFSFGGSKRITPDNGFGVFAMESGASSLQFTPSNPDYHHQFSGGIYAQGLIRGMGLKLASLPTTSQPANLHIDASGNVSKSTA